MSSPRARLSREVIVAAAHDLVADGGVAALSLRPLGARLGVTAPALYAHFKNKEALVAAVAEVEFTRLLEHFQASTDGIADPIDRIKAQSHAYVRYAVENPALFQILFVFRPSWSQPPTATELPIASKTFDVSAAAVQDAIATGQLRPVDPLLASLTIWSAVHGVATFLLAGPALGVKFEATLVDSVIDTIVGGLAAPTTSRRAPTSRPPSRRIKGGH